MEDILNKKTLRLEDIPVMSFGKYMVEALRKYGDEEALVSQIVRILTLCTLETPNRVLLKTDETQMIIYAAFHYGLQ